MTTDDPHDRTDPTKGAYNGFSLADRGAAARWASANATGARRTNPTWCHACGQTEGLIYWHNEDYRTPIAALPLCAWCHWTLHARLKPQQAHVFPTYRDMIRNGLRPLPCPLGSRWSAWRMAFLTQPWGRWPMSVSHDTPAPPLPDRWLFDLLSSDPVDRPPAELSIMDGAPLLAGQHDDRRVFAPLAGRFS